MSVPAGIEAAAHRYLSRITSKFHSIWMEPKSLPCLAGPLPSSVDLRSKLLPVKDQGQEGDCTGQGTSCLVEYNTNSPEWLSAPYLYAKGRQAEGTFPADSGCVIGDVVSSANADGCRLNSLLPQDGDPAECPTAADDADAATRKIGSPMGVNFSDDGTECRANLAAGKLVVIGFTVYPSFESTGSDGIVSADLSGDPLGGHCVVVCGYDDSLNGGSWIIRNSWGTGWAAGGYCFMPYGQLALWSEAWTA